jgi:2-dehydro-3-deoxygluconokinase
MRLKSAQECQVGLLVPTSMGIRMTPIDRQAVHVSKSFIMQATSAETNVASVCSYLGLPVKVLTKFVQDSPISRFIRDDLAGRH